MNDIASDVIAVIARKKRVEKPIVKVSGRLEDLGLNSLDAVDLIFDREKNFDILIPYNANTNNSHTAPTSQAAMAANEPTSTRGEAARGLLGVLS